ncbi:hypothetical protein SAMN04490178_1441 [Propionispora vibrioides]|uniref:Uncharacterized protein n=2 Tax=Propionispora vibrioides TaxID=112903 RepID=A0A1H8Y705_9FIRM|nr:hypothetical protein SAMN04490178_1441 [Propionispora vibrioides]
MPTKLDVEIEKIDTWPTDFLEVATQNKKLILFYHQESKRIDYLCREDVVLRTRPPVNKYKNGYDTLVQSLNEVLNKYNIIGYHCTRLTPTEISAIYREGMKVLSPDLIRSRLNSAREHGHLSQTEFEYLANSPKIKANLHNLHGTRTGNLWFCPNRSTLKECSAVYRLFRSWGGEAMYCGHENDGHILGTLRTIGVPCIVKCSIPISDADQYPPNYVERFLSYFISKDIEYPEPSAGFDMYIKRDLKVSEVLKVIDLFNPTFEALTDCKAWHEQCKIHPEQF